MNACKISTYKRTPKYFIALRPTNCNLYAYAANNPVKYTDPTGMCAYSDSLDDSEENAYIKRQYELDEFRKTTFTADNPLNQLVLDNALGISSTSLTTKSCQTTAIINSYAVKNTDGITGEQILNALTTTNGAINSILLNSDGSPNTALSEISKSLANACGLDGYNEPSINGKITPTVLANLKNGAILGYSLISDNKDVHFGFKNNKITIDSLDENRSAAKKYKENSYWILIWRKFNE